MLPHHAPARGPSAAAAPWVPGVGAEGRLSTPLLPPPPLGAAARASSAPPPPGLLPPGPRHLPAAQARAWQAPLPSATCGLGAGGERGASFQGRGGELEPVRWPPRSRESGRGVSLGRWGRTVGQVGGKEVETWGQGSSVRSGDGV